MGTTIGLYFGLPSKMSRDEEISFIEIFDGKYRRNMGEMFLVIALANMGIVIGFLFMFIPGYVIAIAWSLSYILVADKNYGPLDAIKKSNELTYRKKWTIFFGVLVLTIVLLVAIAILVRIFSAITPVLGSVVGVVCLIFMCSILLGFYSEVYGVLGKDA